MENSEFFTALRSSLGVEVPAIMGAVLLLLAGWVVALTAAAATRRLLDAIGLDERGAALLGQPVGLALGISRVVFWFILLIALVAGFNSLDLQMVSEPFANLINEVLGFLPRLAAGFALAAVGWILAVVVRTALVRILALTTLDERLSAAAGTAPLGASIGQVAYWVILLLFLPLVLAALNLHGLLEPVEELVATLLAFLPNLIGAVVIGVIGLLVARIARGIVVNLMEATSAQSVAQRLGISEQLNLPKVSGTIVFLLIFVPALISALDELRIEAISGPATNLLNDLIEALPHVLAAGLILAITFYVARFVASLVTTLLAGVGTDSLPEKFAVQQVFGELKLSEVVGRLVMFFAMLFAVVEAANRLEFGQVRDLVSNFITFGADVLLGAVILLIGFWLANLVSDAVRKGDRSGSNWLSGLVRVVIIGLVVAMGLRAMGIADTIVDLAFGLTLGSIAIAVALSFGLGGREAAGKLMEHWLSKLRGD